jgi:hypothetical protein|tara:strand:+ start:247 stop:924 length:678 start_codon:yes stop_codon:yes gene_type:complete
VTKLIIAEALISNINEIKSEIDSDENIISISKNEFIESNNAALFKNESYQFVDDEFLTYNELKKLNYNFDDKYIFQVKKSNLKSFSEVSSLIQTFFLDKKKSLDIYPWDLVNIIFSKQKKITNEILDNFCKSEMVFRQFLSYFNKELQRISLLNKYDEDAVSDLLSEKIDYKYELAQKRKSKLSSKNMDNSLAMIYKIEKLNSDSKYSEENAKRFIVSIKNVLQF